MCAAVAGALVYHVLNRKFKSRPQWDKQVLAVTRSGRFWHYRKDIVEEYAKGGTMWPRELRDVYHGWEIGQQEAITGFFFPEEKYPPCRVEIVITKDGGGWNLTPFTMEWLPTKGCEGTMLTLEKPFSASDGHMAVAFFHGRDEMIEMGVFFLEQLKVAIEC